MLITTKENIKKLLGITSTTDDVVLTSIALAVSVRIEQHLLRKIHIEERTEFFDVEDGQKLFFINAYPVSAIAIYNDYGREFVNAIDPDNYTTDAKSPRIVVDKQSLESGYNALKIVYTGGLALTQEALEQSYPDIEMAARIQGAIWYKSKDRLGISSESIQGGGQTNYKSMTLDPAVVESLKPYRNDQYV